MPSSGTGSIPACAGNTATTVRGVYQGRDYPRVCGEHFEPATFCSIQTGSSPRVRGTQRHRARDSNRTGIIPACAGNTDHACAPVRDSRDHPRVCGEHRRWPCADGRRPGIIPACAGNTRECSVFPSMPRDHPRVCGEHAQDGSNRTVIEGSSPRVRGTPKEWCG